MTFVAQLQNALNDSVIQTILSLYVGFILFAKSDDIMEKFSQWKRALKRKLPQKTSP